MNAFDGDPLREHVIVLAENFEFMAAIHRATGEDLGQAAGVAMETAAWAVRDMLKRGCVPLAPANPGLTRTTLRAVQ